MEPRGFALSSSELVTLRRVALGQSDITRLPRADLERLRKLSLIRGHIAAPSITAWGQQYIEGRQSHARLASFDAEGAFRAILNRLTAVAANLEKPP